MYKMSSIRLINNLNICTHLDFHRVCVEYIKNEMQNSYRSVMMRNLQKCFGWKPCRVFGGSHSVTAAKLMLYSFNQN